MSLETHERAEHNRAPRQRSAAEACLLPGNATAGATSAEAPALSTLYENNLGVMYRFLYSQVGQREAAEDLTAQVFVKAVRTLDRSRTRESIQSWLYRVARTMLADYWRSYYRLRATSLEALLEEGWEEPATTAGGGPACRAEERVQHLLDQLPPRYQEVLTCRFLRNYSIKETAEYLGLSEANVKIVQFRALKKAAHLGEALLPPGSGMRRR